MSRLFVLQWKRMGKAVPRLLLGAVIPVLIAGMTVFIVNKIGQDRHANRLVAPVALCNLDSDASLSFVLPYVMETEAAGGFSFQFMGEQEAMSALQDGLVCAILIFPKDMLSGIIDSTNIPARLVLPETTSLPSLLLAKFAEAGTLTLGSAQAGIYAASDLYYEYELDSYVSDITYEINMAELPYAMARESLFSLRAGSATDELSLLTYYLATLFLCVLLFLSSGMGEYLCNAENQTLRRQLRLFSYPAELRSLALFVPLFTVNALCTALLTLGLKLLLPDLSFSGITLLFLFFLTLCVSLYTQLLFRLLASPGRGLLAHLFFGVLMLFLAGGFLPFAFLPKAFASIATYLPLSSCLLSFRKILSGTSELHNVWPVALHCLLLFVLLTVTNRLAEKEVIHE